MSHILDDIYNSKKLLFWTMFQKLDTSLDMSKIIEKINKINSKYFKVIQNNFETIADPFLFKYGEDMYVFFEKVNNDRWVNRLNEGTGEIYCSKLTDSDGILGFSKPILALKETHHISYPFLIQDKDNIYMMPEQRRMGRLELYKCVIFPNEWKIERTLLKGNFVDSTLFYYNDIYWLFTISTNRKNVEYKEQIYYTDNLATGDWNLHSTIRVTNKIESRRGAGNIIVKDGKIYRPVQNNKDYYAQGILFLEITKLSITEYEEKLQYGFSDSCHKSLKSDPQDRQDEEREVGILNRNIHTFNMLDDWIVIDSHNRNKRFFEPDYERSISRWNKKSNRKLMIDKYYKDIGDMLRYIESKNVLDIGINMFNIYNKSYFNNENIKYYQIDISVPTKLKEKLESSLILDDFIELEKRYPEYIDFFDVIISYGVLGYVEFTPTQIGNYLLTASKLLKKDGRLYLKLDKKHMSQSFHKENIVTEHKLLEYFKRSDVIETVEDKEDITLDEISTLLGTMIKLLNKTKKLELNLEIKKIQKDDIVPDHILDDEHVFYVLIKK